jgi:hypothetical protein
MLAEAEKCLTNGNQEWSSSDLAWFEQLKGEFHEELLTLQVSTDPKFYERHLFTRKGETAGIHADLYFDEQLTIKTKNQYKDQEITSYTTLGGFIRGKIKKRLGFYLYVKNTLHKGEDITEENFDPSMGVPITISGKNAYSDDATAYFIWGLPWFQLEFGRNKAQWGPGYRGSLMLSLNNPRFDMLRLKFQLKRFQFTSIHGKLSSGPGPKYIAAHRLEVQLLPWLLVGASESLIYGGREIESAYLNPIMPYHVAEHHLGDKDNNCLGLDVTAFPFINHKLYFELFIDDFTTAENPFTYYGNKFAFLTGWRWTAPMNLSCTDLILEYARIEPFVYTHKDEINVYTNYDKPIGHWLGPNSDDLFLRSQVYISRYLTYTLSIERIRHGDGDINTPHDDSMGKRKSFLSGTVETIWSWGLGGTVQIWRDTFLSFNYHYLTTQNVELVPNTNSQDHQFKIRFYANY